MKFKCTRDWGGIMESHPVRGAWIEIESYIIDDFKHRSHPVRGAWIEISVWMGVSTSSSSHPVRGAWIEIRGGRFCAPVTTVAPREGCVD